MARVPRVITLIGVLVCSRGALAGDAPPAFPGAEGFGSQTPGGRGGRVIEVTNLDDHGLGSLRAACDAEGPRTVVFRVSGTIVLNSDLEIRKPFITIAGQTAPGDGICMRRYKLGVATHDAVVRYLRVRRGDESGLQDDGIGIYEAENVVVDHCSVSWTCDEGVNTWHHTKNATVQWCIVSEALHDSKIRKDHGFAASLGGANTSYHHNLLANCTGRNPSIGGNRSYLTLNLDWRNNLVFNWQHRTLDGKPTSINVVNNYYKPGPATHLKNRLVRIDKTRDMPQGMWFIDGNVLEGQAAISADNWAAGVEADKGVELAAVRAQRPFEVAPVATAPAEAIVEPVLQGAGATLPRRDAVDQRIVSEVRGGKTTYGDGVVRSQNDVGGWPELKSAEPPVDSDHDGIPDWWERKYGLNPNDPADGNGDLNGDGYTNLEKYLNGIDPTRKGK